MRLASSSPRCAMSVAYEMWDGSSVEKNDASQMNRSAPRATTASSSLQRASPEYAMSLPAASTRSPCDSAMRLWRTGSARTEAPPRSVAAAPRTSSRVGKPSGILPKKSG